MAYDDAFFERYGDYLHEPGVRAAHDWVLQIAALNPAFQRVLDLGCGQHNEFWSFSRPRPLEYTGIELVPGRRFPGAPTVLPLDYRQDDLTDVAPGATAFVSLFSSEITAPAFHNAILYRRLFESRPRLQAALVSGFYYADRARCEIVEETGGLVSYQTIQPIEATAISSLWTEWRIVLPVPSQMFGPHVIEVWKFFQRRDECL